MSLLSSPRELLNAFVAIVVVGLFVLTMTTNIKLDLELVTYSMGTILLLIAVIGKEIKLSFKVVAVLAMLIIGLVGQKYTNWSINN